MNNVMFVLEDMEERMPTFIRIAKELNMELHHVETVPQGEASFLVKNPRIVFLDHDLGGKTFVNSREEQTGVHLARWIALNDKNFTERIIVIHSMNPSGVRDMFHALEGYPSVISFGDIYHHIDEVIEQLTNILESDKM